MDYADLNKKHFDLIRQMHIDSEGGALIVLRDGAAMKADNPNKADKKLIEYERRKKSE